MDHNTCRFIEEDPIAVFIDDELFNILDSDLRLGGLSTQCLTKHLMRDLLDLWHIADHDDISLFDPIVLLGLVIIDLDDTSSDPRENITKSDLTVFLK